MPPDGTWRIGAGPAGDHVVAGVTTSHVPAIGAGLDHGNTREPYRRPFFDGMAPVRRWFAKTRPVV